MKRLTVVAPAYNEAECIARFHQELSAELDRLESYASDILFVDDGSRDATFRILTEIASRDPRVGVLKLTRNFGHQAALLAGIDEASGDIVVTMDSDLQHPPQLLARLLAAHEEGNDIVHTFREEARTVGFFRKCAGVWFYRLINVISDVPIKRNASDFRLISKRVAELLRTRIRERNMFLRGIMGWIGYPQATVTYKANDRFAGTRKYSFSRDMQLAIAGLISFSKKPLRAAALVGIAFACFGFVFAGVTVVQYAIGVPLMPGWATLIVLLSIFGGLQLFFMGVLGEYIGSIFDEVKGRPQYLVESAVNVDRSA